MSGVGLRLFRRSLGLGTLGAAQQINMGKIGYVPLKDIKFCNIPLKDHFFAIYHQKVTMLLVCITSVNFANASLFCTQSSSSLALPAQTQPHRRGKVQ